MDSFTPSNGLSLNRAETTDQLLALALNPAPGNHAACGHLVTCATDPAEMCLQGIYFNAGMKLTR